MIIIFSDKKTKISDRDGNNFFLENFKYQKQIIYLNQLAN